MIKEYELDNCFVAQKDCLLSLLYDDNLLEVIERLEFVCELWCKANYAYKGREICKGLRKAIEERFSDLHHRATLQHHNLTKMMGRVDKLESCFGDSQFFGQ